MDIIAALLAERPERKQLLIRMLARAVKTNPRARGLLARAIEWRRGGAAPVGKAA